MSEGCCTLVPCARISVFLDSKISHLLKQFVIRQWMCKGELGGQAGEKAKVEYCF